MEEAPGEISLFTERQGVIGSQKKIGLGAVSQ